MKAPAKAMEHTADALETTGHTKDEGRKAYFVSAMPLALDRPEVRNFIHEGP